MSSRKLSCDEDSDFITDNEATFDLNLIFGDEGNDISLSQRWTRRGRRPILQVAKRTANER